MLRLELPWLEGTDRMRYVAGPLALVVVVLCMASGCARTIYYHHPDYTPERWATDSYECERDMRQSGDFGTGNRPTFYERCLSVRGWTKTRE
jgi:hypothetical protein